MSHIRSNKLLTGFTLLETLVAILVLLTALTGVTGLASQSLHSVSALKHRTIAANLAHEGVELTRNIRDNNVHASDPWDKDFCSPGGGSGYPCDREIACNSTSCVSPPGPPITFNPFTSTFLKLRADTGFYNYVTGDSTVYQRKIHFEQISSNEIRYTVTVTWTGGGSISLTGTLMDWRPPPLI